MPPGGSQGNSLTSVRGGAGEGGGEYSKPWERAGLAREEMGSLKKSRRSKKSAHSQSPR